MAIDATYVSATSFTVDGDQTVSFKVDRKIKAYCGTDGYKFCTIEAASYSSPTTTVTVSGNALTSNLQNVQYGIVTSGPYGSLPRHSNPLTFNVSFDSGTTAQKPAAGAIYDFMASFAFTIPADLLHTNHHCQANPTATATVSLKKNGAAAFGTIEVSTGGVVTLTAASETAFAENDVLSVCFPAAQDATWAGVHLSIYAER